MPNAELKIYLTANLKKRAQRRWLQEQKNEINIISFKKILQKIKLRDQMDQNSKIGSLVIKNDTIVIDNSYISINETVEKIYQLILKKIKYFRKE